MTNLKRKIKTIPSLPNKLKKKKPFIKVLNLTISILALGSGLFIGIKLLLPYINAVKIEKIEGKKISYTKCNTKDYVIINKDKSFNMQLTDSNCKKIYYEGNISIKNNVIYFKYNESIIKDNKEKNIEKEKKGIIDTTNYNISINNNIFVSDINE